MNLVTARLRLRPFTLDDAPFIVALLNSEDWLRFIGDRSVRTIDDARAYLRAGPMAMQAQHGFSLCLVERGSDGAPLGMCGLIRREALPDVDIGYALMPEFHGQGYAREAAAATLAHGFGAIDLKRIVAIMDPANRASARVCEAIGMRFEGLRRVPGWNEDSAVYAITRRPAP
jgi:RimJ/RimL family protein N-acetyltransferase